MPENANQPWNRNLELVEAVHLDGLGRNQRESPQRLVGEKRGTQGKDA